MKNTRVKAGAAIAAPRLDQQTKNERTNKVLQTWRENEPLQGCSLAARGLWIEMVSIMHGCEPYGHLVEKGAPMKVRQLAGIVGEPPSLVDQLLAELWRAEVFSYKDKCIYSREMTAPSDEIERLPSVETSSDACASEVDADVYARLMQGHGGAN